MLPPSLISSLASPGQACLVTICSEMGPGKVRPLTFLSPPRDTSLSLVRHRGSWPLIGPPYGHEHYGHTGHLRQYSGYGHQTEEQEVGGAQYNIEIWSNGELGVIADYGLTPLIERRATIVSVESELI